MEPGCSCWGDWQGGDLAPVSGPFRDPPVRCSSFEALVLPLDPALEEAYWAYIERGEKVRVQRCQWPGCRREVASVGPAAKYCAPHAETAKRQATRRRVRQYRERKAQRAAV